jgi:hypothetical protein
MINKLIEYFIIKNSGLFDARYYLKQYKDCRDADVDPIWHYINCGWQSGRNPSLQFNTINYLRQNPELRDSRKNPLVHYIQRNKD